MSLQEVEQYRLSHLELLKDEVINLAIRALATHITSGQRDEAVATEAKVVEPLAEVAGLADIKQFIASYEQIDPCTVFSSDREVAESSLTMFM